MFLFTYSLQSATVRWLYATILYDDFYSHYFQSVAQPAGNTATRFLLIHSLQSAAGVCFGFSIAKLVSIHALLRSANFRIGQDAPEWRFPFTLLAECNVYKTPLLMPFSIHIFIEIRRKSPSFRYGDIRRICRVRQLITFLFTHSLQSSAGGKRRCEIGIWTYFYSHAPYGV